MTENARHLKKIINPLLVWYRENARDLPWRRTDDPYHIWISEIMLQQTRVTAVLGYYDRFLAALPNVYALANVEENVLMKLWEGLGYYSRARNMQKTAQIIVREFNGKFPESYEELLALPGIGEYTAGAIASAAYGIRVPAVDGNVLRVLSRVLESYDDISDARVKKNYRDVLQLCLPKTGADMRICNQAMMELGATVCIPNGEPKCKICPISEYCNAYKHGTTLSLPVKSGKKQRRFEEKTVFVLYQDGKVALRKRAEKGLLAGLWEFPNEDKVIEESDVYQYLLSKGLRVTEWKKRLHAKHIFTHVEWHMTGYVVEVFGDGMDDCIWVEKSAFDDYAIPSAFSKFVDEVKKQDT